MPFVPLANTAEAELRYTLDDQQVETTLYFTNGDGWTAANLEPLGAALLTWWATNLQDNIAQNCVLREIYLTDQSTQSGETFTYVTGLPLAGQASTDAMPNSIALCVSFRTAKRGRSYRGRNYVPGIPKSVVVESAVTSEYQSAIQNAYQGLLAFSLTANATWVVASRYTNGAWRTTGETTPVRSVVVIDPTVDSQRRRLPGRGD